MQVVKQPDSESPSRRQMKKAEKEEAMSPQSVSTPEDLTNYITALMTNTQASFHKLADSINSRIDDLGSRMDDLEKSIMDMMKVAGIEEEIPSDKLSPDSSTPIEEGPSTSTN